MLIVYMKKIGLIYFLALTILSSCDFHFANSETSEIGSISPSCLDSLAWGKMCSEFSIDGIKNEKLLKRVDDIKNHFIKPDYILYFKDEPEEIIGCDWYSIRVAYNEKIVDQAITGLSPF